jgi:Methyltransferase domain
MNAKVLPSPEIWHRADFGMLCEWRKLYRCIEVGVDRGEFSDIFLSRCYNCTLYLGIDPYLPDSVMPWDRSGDFQSAALKYAQYPSKAKLVLKSSQEAATALTTSSDLYSRPYDFVYVDANHTKEAVLQDMQLWVKFLSPQGILAGHDYGMSTDDHKGVKEAVDEFAANNGLVVYYTTGDDPQSWYIYKQGIPSSNWMRNDQR